MAEIEPNLRTNTSFFKQDGPKSVTFFCPFDLSYTTVTEYSSKDLIKRIVQDSYPFRVVLINNDESLYGEIVKKVFKSNFSNMQKLFSIQVDYIFSPINKLLFFNLGIIGSITENAIIKNQLKIVMYDNGLFLFSQNLGETLISTFKSKFNFKFVESNEDFFLKANALKGNPVDMNIYEILKLKPTEIRPSIEVLKQNSKRRLSVSCSPQTNGMTAEFRRIQRNFSSFDLNPKASADKKAFFSTDMLIYWLFILSVEKIDSALLLLKKEGDLLKRMYLTLSEIERKDFFRRLHTLETSVQIMNYETEARKKMLKQCKIQFTKFNEAVNKHFFKRNFNFSLDLIIAKNNQAVISVKKLKNVCRMIKENYRFIIEDCQEAENQKLNQIMRVLAILTTIYAPFGLVSGIFGMNVLIPYQYDENGENSALPFYLIILGLMILFVFEILLFKLIKWL